MLAPSSWAPATLQHGIATCDREPKTLPALVPVSSGAKPQIDGIKEKQSTLTRRPSNSKNKTKNKQLSVILW